MALVSITTGFTRIVELSSNSFHVQVHLYGKQTGRKNGSGDKNKFQSEGRMECYLLLHVFFFRYSFSIKVGTKKSAR